MKDRGSRTPHTLAVSYVLYLLLARPRDDLNIISLCALGEIGFIPQTFIMGKKRHFNMVPLSVNILKMSHFYPKQAWGMLRWGSLNMDMFGVQYVLSCLLNAGMFPIKQHPSSTPPPPLTPSQFLSFSPRSHKCWAANPTCHQEALCVQ